MTGFSITAGVRFTPSALARRLEEPKPHQSPDILDTLSLSPGTLDGVRQNRYTTCKPR